MTVTSTAPIVVARRRRGRAVGWLQANLPKLVLSPSLAATLVFVYGLMIWTSYLSLSNSKMRPAYDFVGLEAYERLWRQPIWHTALVNLAIFGVLYIGACILIGLLLAILLDQRIRFEGVLRPIYLYPMALSFIVTGTAWKWFLNPGLGLEKTLHEWGWSGFSFDWLVDPQMAIYTIVIAAVWQSSGFVMAMFLAGLRGIDQELIRAAQIDGAPAWKLYWRIIIPQLRPAFLSAVIVLAHMTIKTYDLVVVMTDGGPGSATVTPAYFMYSYTFTRNQMAVGSASAVMMLMTIMALIVPYLYSELRSRGR